MAGVPAEEIVDEHFNCRTPELRQKLIEEIRKMVGADMIKKAFSV